MRAVIISLVLSAALVGCTTLPKPMAAVAVTPIEIVRAIECEIATVFDRGGSAAKTFRKWYAGSTIDLDDTDKLQITPGLTFKGTLPGSSVKLSPATVAVENTTIRKHQIKFRTNFVDFDPETPNGRLNREACPTAGTALASSGLGLAEWLGEIAESMEGSGSAVTDFAYDVDFSVTRTLGGGLSFETTFATVSFDKGSAAGTRRHHLAIDFVAENAAAAAPKKGRSATPSAVIQDLKEKQTLRDLQSRIIQVEPGQTVVVQ